jgi:hypothetical protein
MSLNWNSENCVGWEELQESAKERSITDAIIWASCVVGIPEIKADNIVEFHYRSNLYDAIAGARMHDLLPMSSDNKSDWAVPRPIKVDDLQKRIGLMTNAPEFTTPQFFKNLRKMYDREVEKSDFHLRGILRGDEQAEFHKKQGCPGCFYADEKAIARKMPCCTFGQTCTSPPQFDKDGKCLTRKARGV